MGLGAEVGALEEAGARDGGKVQHEIANGDANARGVELRGGGTRRHKHTVGKVLQRLQGRRRSHCLVALRRSLPVSAQPNTLLKSKQYNEMIIMNPIECPKQIKLN